MSQSKRLRLLITGRVQGVAFRAHTTRTARTLSLHGWVRNLSDGSVEVLAEGDESALEELRSWCLQGPARASVTDVKAQWQQYIGDLDSFFTREG